MIRKNPLKIQGSAENSTDRPSRLAVEVVANADQLLFCHPECGWLPEKGELQVCNLWSDWLPLRRSGTHRGRYLRCHNCIVWAKEPSK